MIQTRTAFLPENPAAPVLHDFTTNVVVDTMLLASYTLN